MISITTQATIAFINKFFLENMPLSIKVIMVSIIVTLCVISLFLRHYYKKEIEYTQEELRNLKRSIADFEAQEAQHLAELDDLRRSEKILIRRNAHLERDASENSFSVE